MIVMLKSKNSKQTYGCVKTIQNKYLSLSELPIVDLMAVSSSHFAKLKDFIQMELPYGFPVKIEIPLFHARITFRNIFAMDIPEPFVTRIEEYDRLTCVLDDGITYIGFPNENLTPL